MRNISFSMTTPQFIAGTKDVTRRMGWKNLKVGDVLMAVEKGMGLKKGEKLRKLGRIGITKVERQALELMERKPAWGVEECRREGFPDMMPIDFIVFFCKGHQGCEPSSIVTRIEFVKLED